MKCLKPTLYTILFLAMMTGCRTSYHVSDVQYQDYRLEEKSSADDAALEEILSPYRVKMDRQMNEVLIVSTKQMSLSGPESTLGNFSADATEIMAERYLKTEVHFAIHNSSGLRIKTIGKGDITLSHIYQLMPFDNTLVTVELSGDEVQKLSNFMASKGGWPSSASLTYEIVDDNALNVKIDGKAIDPAGTYVMATNNYIIESANYQDYLKAKEITTTNVYVRDAVAEYLRSLAAEGLQYEPVLDKRVIKRKS